MGENRPMGGIDIFCGQKIFMHCHRGSHSTDYPAMNTGNTRFANFANPTRDTPEINKSRWECEWENNYTPPFGRARRNMKFGVLSGLVWV